MLPALDTRNIQTQKEPVKLAIGYQNSLSINLNDNDNKTDHILSNRADLPHFIQKIEASKIAWLDNLSEEDRAAYFDDGRHPGRLEWALTAAAGVVCGLGLLGALINLFSHS